MSTLNFPNNPSLEDTYTFGEKTWVFTGKGWRLKSDSFILENKTVKANSEVFVANGSAVTFTLSSTDLIGKVNNSIVTVDGLTQIPGLQYTASGNTINFSDAPVTNSLIEIRLFELVDANSVIEIREFVPGNSFFTLVFDEANNASNIANVAAAQVEQGFDQANAAFNQANTATDIGQGAFNQANTATDIGQGAFNQANTATDIGQGAFNQANTDFTTITISTGTFGNASFIPVITVEANGRISDISTQSLGGNVQFTTIGVGTTPDTANTGSIRATGDITAFFSDERLKDVIGPIPNALQKLSQLSGVVFTNNDTAAQYGYIDKSEQVGLLAGQVLGVLPQIVTRAPFDITKDENGNDISKSGQNYLTVRYEKLIPLLVEAIKEQQVIIDDLRKRL